MPDVTFAKQFKWSPNGIKIKTFEPGKRTVSARCAECAKEAGVLKKPASTKKPAATDNKALAGAAENKGS